MKQLYGIRVIKLWDYSHVDLLILVSIRKKERMGNCGGTFFHNFHIVANNYGKLLLLTKKIELIIVWQRNWPDVRSRQCLCSSCPACHTGRDVSSQLSICIQFGSMLQQGPLSEILLCMISTADNKIYSIQFNSILVIDTALCQTSCPLRTVH